MGVWCMAHVGPEWIHELTYVLAWCVVPPRATALKGVNVIPLPAGSATHLLMWSCVVGLVPRNLSKVSGSNNACLVQI